MTKIISIKVSDNEYFKLLELKAKLKAKSWSDFARKILEVRR